TYGVGMYIGFYVAGLYVDKNSLTTGGHNWKNIWIFPCLFAAGVSLMFLVLFKNDKKKLAAV
ncbi:MAG: MFS transporter, partial [Chitinophagaceae bacterium]|nr:MFS transporter [Chitinophagaceae bacterium]